MYTVLWHSLFLGGAWHRLVGGYQYPGTTCQSHRQVSSSARRILGAGGCTGDGVKRGWLVLRKHKRTHEVAGACSLHHDMAVAARAWEENEEAREEGEPTGQEQKRMK